LLEGEISNELIGGKVIRSCASVIVARKRGWGRGEGEGYVCNGRRERGELPVQHTSLWII
jgi:hypothetical protein